MQTNLVGQTCDLYFNEFCINIIFRAQEDNIVKHTYDIVLFCFCCSCYVVIWSSVKGFLKVK